MSTPMLPGIASGMNARGPLSALLLQILVAAVERPRRMRN